MEVKPIKPVELKRAIKRLWPDSPSPLDDAAFHLGTSRRTLERWLKGTSQPPIPEMLRKSLGYIQTTPVAIQQTVWRELTSPEKRGAAGDGELADQAEQQQPKARRATRKKR